VAVSFDDRSVSDDRLFDTRHQRLPQVVELRAVGIPFGRAFAGAGHSVFRIAGADQQVVYDGRKQPAGLGPVFLLFH